MTTIDSMEMNKGRIINHENSGTEGVGVRVGSIDIGFVMLGFALKKIVWFKPVEVVT